ncbi:MAG: hypothetical protein EBS48_03845 [Actinobacteria bacterium]|nr:hypothetical protein [Actinomycetota bacterium]
MTAARRTVACLLAALVLVLVPAAVAVRAAHATLFDTGEFVKVSADLARDESVRADLVDSFTGSIVDALDPGSLVPAGTLAAVGLTPADLERRVDGIIRSAVSAAVSSEVFAVLWEEASRQAHTSFMDAIRNGITVDGVSVDMSTLVREVSAKVKDDGVVGRLIDLAALVPSDADLSFRILDGNGVSTARAINSTTSVLRWLLPLLALAGAAGVATAWPTRRTGVLIASASVTAGAVMVPVLRSVAAGRLESATGDNSGTARAAFDVATSSVTAPTVAIALVALGAAGTALLRRRQPA